jgi:hypothetical protein
MTGKQNWFVVDGYRPFAQADACDNYEGHECFMILNCNNHDAHCLIDVYFEDREPVLGIPYTAKARRVSAFRSSDSTVFGGLELPENLQYSLNIRSDIGVVVQYGRMDVNQSNLSYLATLGFPQ